jgi:quinol monooxygenase YgiN
MAHVLINKLTAKPDQRQRVVDILVESGQAFDDNADCLLYLVTESADDPNLIWVVDLWTSEEAHNSALEASLDQSKVKEAMSLMEGAPEQIKVRAVGGKGFPTETLG